MRNPRPRILAAVALCGAVALNVVGPCSDSALAAQVWLAGVDPVSRSAMGWQGNSDYMDLFTSDAPWKVAARNVQVFKTTAGFLLGASDDAVRDMIVGLHQRHISLALEALMLTGKSGCGFHVEGYADSHQIEAVGLRVKRLGGELDYVAMDEPLWFGHEFAGPHACRSSLADIANDAATKAATLRRIFPNVQIGDIEPLAAGNLNPNWLEEISQWIAAYRSAAGQNLAFFDVDLDWHGSWQTSLTSLVPVLTAAGVKFGIIYDGDPDDATGLAWALQAEKRFVEVESDATLVPDQAILQTWMRHPSHMLPESQSGTMTWLVTRYAAAETRIELQRRDKGELEGTLSGPDGRPIGGQRLQVSSVDTANVGPPAEAAQSGTVPKDAVRALFILRINAECRCSGPVNVTIGQVAYRDEQSGEEVRRDFMLPAATKVAGGAKIVARTGQSFAPNTPSWPVTAGDTWTMHVPLGASEASARSGYVAIVFLGVDGREMRRIRLPFAPAVRPIGDIVTDAAGRFSFVANTKLLRFNTGFEVEFAGSEGYRLSSAFVP